MNRMSLDQGRELPRAEIEPGAPECPHDAEIRLGMVNYINTAPIYEPWKERGKIEGCRVFEAPPSTLNRLLADGHLDLGFVSCYEYAQRPESYRILPDLSISANGPVGSVFLFSKLPISQLNSEKVLLTNQSDTSAALTRVVLEEFYGVFPSFRTGPLTESKIEECNALLAIGDDALRLRKKGGFLLQLDLGELWKQQTGLPFVFAVCAVREELCREKPEQLARVYGRLVDCRIEGARKIRAICEAVAPRIPLEVEDCYRYLQGIEFDLGQAKKKALEYFFRHLIARGEAPGAALPLKIHEFAEDSEEAASS